MNRVRAVWRLWRVALHLVRGMLQILLQFPRLSQDRRDQRVQAWASALLRTIGVRLDVTGTPAPCGPMLMVANHISWLDIVALHAARHCRFVSKSDIQRWPLLGTLATAGGTLYVERASRRDAMRVVHSMARALKDGDVLAIFPEGTTGDGAALLPFHANLVQAAIAASAPVQPVALRFLVGRSGRRSHAASYVGDETLVGSLWRTLCASDLRVSLVYGEPQHALGRDRRAWTQDLHAAIEGLLRR